MSSCLIILNHTLRINSRIFREALKNHESVTVVYVSPWYNKSNEKRIINSGDQSFFRGCLSYFSKELEEKLSIPLYLLKSKNPSQAIDKMLSTHKFDNVFYDLPLFGNNTLSISKEMIVIDSDTYDPSCEKMTAKSRWVYWSKNRSKNTACDPEIKACNHLKLDLPVYKYDNLDHLEIKKEINSVLSRLEVIIPKYHKTRNHKEGSTKLSKYLHHGIIDAAEIIAGLFNILPEFLDNTHPVVPLLRQLAFREICIRKSRIKNLSMEISIDDWAKTLLDQKSYQNLINEFPGKFTRDQFLRGKTGILALDNEIKRLKEEKWMPNRIRMWVSSQCYYGLGGGINSLETLIDLFNMYSDDGQSPNNYVCCVEAMRLQYGKVMNYNFERTFKLVSGIN